jgi:hypothetical protein
MSTENEMKKLLQRAEEENGELFSIETGRL